MPRRLFVFENPDRVIAGTVGPPGERAFYLQARQAGALVTVGLEKSQVATLAHRIGEILVALHAGVPRSTTETRPRGGLEEPIVELFRVGVLTLGWDAARGLLVVEARPPVSDDEELHEVADDDPDGPDLLRVTLTPDDARAFAIHAASLVAAGRPTCPFCGQPLDPMGHFCPKMNGHLN